MILANILFMDICGFTEFAAALAPATVVSALDALFTDIDVLSSLHGVEKIKTIGDCVCTFRVDISPF